MEHLKKINMKREYNFRDPVVKNVVDKFVSRSNVGYDKYGNSLDDERRLKMKGLQKYLNDIQEELMDAVLYIQSARDELQDLHEESLINKFNDDEYAEDDDQPMKVNGLDVDYPKYENDYDDEEED